ncbi:MAG: cell division protein SepF [Candidatus Thermoplasmatota archaeon]|nr:cell division protein SepF [Candidatus Thermoplasmatota archaeon]
MAFFKKKEVKTEAPAYLDLGEYAQTHVTSGEDKGTLHIKMAEMHRYEDMRDIVQLVYDGNVVVMDFSPVSGDDIVMKRIGNELKQMTNDIHGDIAGLGQTMLILAPAGVKVDRQKLRF